MGGSGMSTSYYARHVHVWQCKARHGWHLSSSKNFCQFSKSQFLLKIFNPRHLLILNGHGSHVTLEAIAQAHEFGLNMVTLQAHTSHVLEPLDVSCFKPFKTTFKKKKDNAMVKNNHCEPYNYTLASWVHKSLDQSLSKKISIMGLRLQEFGL